LAQSLTFSLANLPTGSGPAMVVPIDVNGTGHPGLVCSDFGFVLPLYGFGDGGGGGSTLSVFTNDGFGNLSPSATLDVGLDPVGLAVADVNGDGWPDIICANVSSDTLTVLTNNRHGSFGAAGTYSVDADGPVFVAAADVNGDGYVDLISANYESGSLTILTNKGDGTFKISGTITTAASPNCIAAVDINGDGSVDLVCANNNYKMLIFTNNGRGVFAPGSTLDATNTWVVGTDVDGNGSIDLVTANGSSTLSVYTNDGSGKFNLKSTPLVDEFVGSVVAADINGDGKVDLVCPNNNNGFQGAMEVLTNDGSGNFLEATEVLVGAAGIPNYPNFVTAADFNGDGNLDIAVSCYGSAEITELVQVSGTVPLTPKPIVTITSPANDAVIPTTENFEITATAVSPSKIEVMTYFVGTNFFGSTAAPFSVQITAGRIPPGTYALQAKAVDSAGHVGWSPEVQINVTGASVHPPSAPPLTFSSTTLPVGSGPNYVLPVDLNGDGHVDLVTTDFGFFSDFFGCFGDLEFGEGYGATGSNLTVWINNGHGGFSSSYDTEVGFPGITSEPTCVAAADLNSDGHLELISSDNYINEMSILTNKGGGVFKQEEGLPIFTGGGPGGGGREPVFFTVADVNGDGKPDLITVNTYDVDNNISILTNGGNFFFTNSATLPVGFIPSCVAATDINGDGSIDLVCANYGDSCGDGNTLTVFTNDGVGDFTSNATITVGYGPVCVVAADVNGDGYVDLITANQGDFTLTVLTNDGHGNFTLQSTIPAIGPSWVVAADLTGSGHFDLAVANSFSGYRGSVTVFLNDGRGNFSSNTTVQVGSAAFNNYPNCIAAADFNGDGEMDLVVANFGSSSLTVLTQTTVRPPPPVITITSPINGASFSTTTSFAIQATVQQTGKSTVNQVEFLLDGGLLGISTGSPFSLSVPAGSVPAGEHNLQAVAVNSAGINVTSAVVQITLNVPGTALIDFDVLNTSKGAVGGTTLANYLAQYGVTLANVTFGTEMEAVDTNGFTGNVEVEAPSSPNIFTQAGLNQPVSFTLRFATNLQAFGFTRAGLFASSGLISHPQWTATAFDSSGTALSSVTEPLILTTDSVGQRSFVLTGNGIASVRFDSDSQGTAAFSAVLLDDLLLDYNAVTPAVSVALSVTVPATNDLVAPATITLSANVVDQLSSTFTVFFYAGPTLLGTVSSSPLSGGPYQVTVNNVLPGNYALQARVVDLSSGISALSPILPITVQLGPNSTLIDFDALNTTRAPQVTAAVETYLSHYGVTVASLSPGTALTVDSQQHIAGGSAVLAPSPPNVLTQTGSNGPVQFTLRFAPVLTQFGFTRPELLANPFVSHPAWQVTAFDGSGAIVDQAGETEIDSSTNVGAREFSLGTAGGPGIAAVQFASQGTGLTTFNAMLVDNLVLTTNTGAFPPAVAITSPVSGVALARPPAVTVTAAASDPTGIASVSFYANSFSLGIATGSPYAVQWVFPRPGNYQLAAVASNNVGLAWTSSVVNIAIQPSASQFAIVSQPASQMVAAGGSATFAVGVTGTNQATYQWFYNSNPILGATSPTLVLAPPINNTDAGTYFVEVTEPGPTVLTSDSAVLTVIDPPLVRGPFGQTVPPGTEVTLTVFTSASVTYQWLLNGNSIPGATDNPYVIENAQPRQSGNYQVLVANQVASTLSAPAAVIVETAITIPETNTNFQNRASFNPLLGPISDSNDLATVQRGAPLPDGVPVGNSIWFTWTPNFTGTATLTTQGSDFDTVMAVYTGTALSSLKAVAADDDSGGFLTSLVTLNVTAGTAYQIAVDGHQGASGRVVLGFPAGTGYRILNPTSGESVPVIVRNPASQTVGPGAPVNLSVVATSATKITYQWYFQGVPIHGATASALAIAHVQPGSVGLYDVLVANAAGSAQSELAAVQIGASQGGKPTSTGSKFGTSTTTASPAELATDLRPFSSGGDSAGFSVSQVFSTVGATTQPGEPQPCGQVGTGSEWFSYTAPASGIMQINTDGSTFNTILGVYTGPGTSFASLDEVGCGYSTNYLEQGQPSVILTNVTKGTTFFILVQGYQNSAGVAKLQIGLGQPLAFRNLPASQLVTAGNKATFAALAIGSTPVSYQWQLNGANLAGATKSTFTVTEAQNEAVGNYTVIASNPLGAVTSSPPAALTIQYAPAIVAGPSNETVTLGLPAKFSVETVGVNVKTNLFVYQWYFDGAPIPKATASSLLLPVTHWTNQGTYSLVISNSYGPVASGPATLTLIDKIPPTVAITAPANDSETTSGLIIVTGTAADKVGIAQVQVEVNSNGFFAASGTTNWNERVGLTAGANVISAYSTDLAGNSSLIVKHTITYNSAAMKLETQTKPAAHSSLKFSGTYSGLFYPTDGASRANSGYFTATIASGTSGAFTANILLDSKSYPFTGKFDSAGVADSLVPRSGKSPVTASLRLDVDSPRSQMTGFISSADGRSVLRAGLTVFGAGTNPARVDAGQFALVVPSGAVAPAGYLAITNTTGGAALVTGTLADGESIFRVAPKAEGQAIPFYTPLYSGQGLFLAWISFTNSAPQANLGPAIWIGPGFTNLTDIIIVK